MKIAQICPYVLSRPGGVKSHIFDLSRQLRKKGYTVRILAPFSGTEWEHQPDIECFGKNLSILFCGTKLDLNIALGKEWKRLRDYLHNESFDIIHFHTIWNPLLPFQIRMLSKCGHVATFHNTPAENLTGKLIRKTIMPVSAAILYRFLDEIISVSESQCRCINSLSSKEITIIPNGIDLTDFKPTNNGIPGYKDGRFTLLFLGRLEPRKGLMHAIKAFRFLKERYSEIRLLIAGDGDLRPLPKNLYTIRAFVILSSWDLWMKKQSNNFW